MKELQMLSASSTTDVNGIEKRKRGRPKGTTRGRSATRGITMDDERWLWASSQDGGASAYLRKLIDADRNARA